MLQEEQQNEKTNKNWENWTKKNKVSLQVQKSQSKWLSRVRQWCGFEWLLEPRNWLVVLWWTEPAHPTIAHDFDDDYDEALEVTNCT